MVSLEGSLSSSKNWRVHLALYSESDLEQGPVGLSGVQAASGAQVGKIFVVCPHDEGLSPSLQPVSPLLQSRDHGQEFPVPHVVV